MQSAPDEGVCRPRIQTPHPSRCFRVDPPSPQGERVERERYGSENTMWPDRRLIDLFKIEFPIVLAPMAGAMDAELAIAVAAGRRARLAALRDALGREGARAGQHHPPARHGADQPQLLLPHAGRGRCRARGRLARAARALLRRARASIRRRRSPPRNRAPFDAAMCEVVEELKPEVVSFHFGLPEPALLQAREGGRLHRDRARRPPCEEARWLEEHGADAIIAQGAEAGGHRGMFLTDNHRRAGRHLRAGAAGGRCGEGAGDRGGRHRRCARHRGGVRARRRRRADRHRLSALSGIEDHRRRIAPRWRRRATTAPRSPI